MNKIIRKTAAALLAAALVGGAVPAGYSGFTLNDTAVTASAAEAKTIAVGDVFNIGDSIDFGDGCWYVYDSNIFNAGNEKAQGIQTLIYNTYTSTNDGSANFHVFSIGTTLMIPSGNPAQPTGIRVVSGDGTQSHPFMFDVTYDNAQTSIIAVGDVFNIGDSIDFGDGSWIVWDSYIYNNGNKKLEGEQTLVYGGYTVATESTGGFHALNIGTTLLIPSDNPVQPTGIRVVSGDGTENYPFVFELVYDETQISPIAVGDVFRLGDSIDFGDGSWIVWDSNIYNTGNKQLEGKQTLVYGGYTVATESTGGFHALNIGTTLLIPSENSDVPVGIKVVKGDGSFYDPFMFDVTYETSASFSTASLTLKDEIGLNFFVSGADDTNWEEFTVKFSGKCDEAGKTVHLGTKNGRFCATAHLTANKMGADIRAELYKGNEKVHELTCSAYKYLKALEETNDMAAATLLYGLAAEDYFNGTDNSAKIEELGVRFVGDEEHFNAEKVRSMCAHFETDVTALPDDIKISAVLNDKTALRLYSEYGSRNGDYGRFDEITGILPAQLMDDRTLNIGGTEYTFSPMTWSYRALRNPLNETDTKTLNLAKALVIYGYMAIQKW